MVNGVTTNKFWYRERSPLSDAISERNLKAAKARKTKRKAAKSARRNNR